MSWNEEVRISCPFSLKCPRLWDRLQPTAEEGVRHCHECDRDAHLALTKEDFRRHSEEGRCIAVPVVQPDDDADPDEPCWLAGLNGRHHDDGIAVTRPASGDNRGSQIQKDEQRPCVHILTRPSPGTCETYLKKCNIVSMACFRGNRSILRLPLAIAEIVGVIAKKYPLGGLS